MAEITIEMLRDALDTMRAHSRALLEHRHIHYATPEQYAHFEKCSAIVKRDEKLYFPWDGDYVEIQIYNPSGGQACKKES